MSIVTVSPGACVQLDASDKKMVIFDFDTSNLAVGVQLASYVITIAAVQQNGLTALTKDNDSLVTGNRKVTLRLLATTATLGDCYTVAVKGITNESPAQEKEYSIQVLITNL